MLAVTSPTAVSASLTALRRVGLALLLLAVELSAGDLCGRVVTGEREAIAEATVVVHLERKLRHSDASLGTFAYESSPELASGRTSPDGKFELQLERWPTLYDGLGLRITAIHPTFGVATRLIQDAAELRPGLDLELRFDTPTRTLVVQAPDGSPARDVEVKVAALSSPLHAVGIGGRTRSPRFGELYRPRTDEAGRALLRVPYHATLQLSTASFGDQWIDASTAELSVRLAPLVTQTVTIVPVEDGEPTDPATIDLQVIGVPHFEHTKDLQPVLSPYPAPLRASPDIDGKIELVRPRGHVRFELERAAESPLVPGVPQPRGGYCGTPRLAPPEVPAPVEIPVAPGYPTLGHLVDEGGAPIRVPGVGIRLRDWLHNGTGGAWVADTVTDEAGRFAFTRLHGAPAACVTSLPAGVDVPPGLLWAELELPTDPVYGRDDPAPPSDAVFLSAAAVDRVSGRVLEPDDTPAAGAWIVVDAPEAGRGMLRRVTERVPIPEDVRARYRASRSAAFAAESFGTLTDESGRFELLLPRVAAPRTLRAESLRGAVRVELTDSIDAPFELRLEPSGLTTLNVSARATDGEPLAKARLSLSRRRTGDRYVPVDGRSFATASDGRVEIPAAGAVGDVVALRIEGPGLRTWERWVRLRVSPQVLEITTARLVNRRGLVVDAQGAPISGATVLHRPPGNGSFRAPESVTLTDEGGRFELSAVDAELPLLIVTCEGYAPGGGLAADTEVRIALRPGGRDGAPPRRRTASAAEDRAFALELVGPDFELDTLIRSRGSSSGVPETADELRARMARLAKGDVDIGAAYGLTRLASELAASDPAGARTLIEDAVSHLTRPQARSLGAGSLSHVLPDAVLAAPGSVEAVVWRFLGERRGFESEDLRAAAALADVAPELSLALLRPHLRAVEEPRRDTATAQLIAALALLDPELCRAAFAAIEPGPAREQAALHAARALLGRRNR